MFGIQSNIHRGVGSLAGPVPRLYRVSPNAGNQKLITPKGTPNGHGGNTERTLEPCMWIDIKASRLWNTELQPTSILHNYK